MRPPDPWAGIKRLFRLPLGRRGVDSEVEAELRFHLEERIEDLIATGLSRAEAEREAQDRFGDLRRIGSEVKAIDGTTVRRRERGEMWHALVRDARLSLRSLRRHSGFASAVVLTLGLGMGATASIYTLVQHVVLDPLPFPNPERLVRLKNPVPGVGTGDEWNLSLAQFVHYRRHVPELEAIGVYRRGGVTALVSEEPRRVQSARVTSDMMDLLGASAVRGRLFRAEDDAFGGPELAVVSHAFWRAALAGEDAIVGKPIRLDERPVEIIGVMAPGVELPPELGQVAGGHTDIWLPMRFNPAGPFYNNHVFPVIARLAPAATGAEAEQRMQHLLPQLPEAYPQAYTQGFIDRYGFHTVAYPLKDYALGSASRNLWILFAAVGLVLVIACANVVNLFLARLETRRREFAVRAALGARRSHLVREAFVEGLVLVAGGGIVASLVAVAGARWLVRLAPPGIPRLDVVTLDWRGVGFTMALALLIAAALAVLPALRRRAGAGLGSLGQGGRAGTAGVERQRVRRALVVTQMALALMLVVGSALLLQSFRRLRAVDPGFSPDGVLALQWFPPYQRYDSLTRVWRLNDEVLSRIRAIPGVVSAGAATELPLTGGYGCVIQGFDEQVVFDRLKEAGLTTCAGQVPASPGYFETLQIPLLAGRSFTDDDNIAPERGAVIVSKAFAERFWPGENPIGKAVGASGRTIPPFSRVVGVVGDVTGSSLDEPPAIAVYYPIVPVPGGNGWYEAARYLVIRVARGDPMAVLPAVRYAVSEVDPAIPIANAEPMQESVDRSMGRLSFTMRLLGIAGGVALALAAIGLYGVISYVVARRTNEIGVRMALGARPAQVEGFVVVGALRLAAAGLLLGLAGAVLSARVLGSLLYGVTPSDPVAYGAAVLLLATVAGLAAWLPARRAAKVEPTVALRAE